MISESPLDLINIMLQFTFTHYIYKTLSLERQHAHALANGHSACVVCGGGCRGSLASHRARAHGQPTTTISYTVSPRIRLSDKKLNVIISYTVSPCTTTARCAEPTTRRLRGLQATRAPV